MKVAQGILNSLKEDSPVREIRIGVFWTGVWSKRCGIALTLQPGHEHLPAIRKAGNLKEKTALELANLWDSDLITERSVAVAAINSLIEPAEEPLMDLDAGEILLERGAGKRIALVGHFPFVSQLKEVASELWVLELNPQPGDLPASAAPQIIPQAEILAITGSALINGTIDQLLELASPKSFVIVMGPSAPLSRVWFDFGVDVVSSSLVIDPPRVLECLSQGGNLHQMVPFGIRKVSLIKK
ncbi:MAG: DUF364 domain-containing protein [Caldiserica bacterium]|nr:DUF364 domain-containing protein [Caldisericota bacterium]MDH7562535.1 DUF364 domain-containing protein [Caldisericota bacterium]